MRKGPAGTSHLNPLLQQLLNPPHQSRAEVPRYAGGGGGWAGGGSVFRLGDRVIQLVNNYDKDIFNGDQGMVRGLLVACFVTSVGW
jgi:exodeoxyribonuclease V alpha subunit